MQEPPQSDSGALDELVALALDALESEGEPGLERVVRDYPQAENQLRSRIAALRAAGLIDSAGDAPPERLGPFKLIRPLGAGGMGIVYLAQQEELGREVALKVIRPEQLFFPGARKRFRREVEIIASLQHPGVVPIHAVGEANGVPYFAMDLLHGETLGAALARLATRDVGTLTGADLALDRTKASYLFEGSWEDACARVIQQAAEALEYAHQRGVVHRDIKPSNILVTDGSASRAVLLDFGLAASKNADDLTRTGALMGSLKYMAPEQARGASEDVGPRTDIYSLGTTLYELLTLRSAIDGATETDLLLAIDRGASKRVREVNPRVSWELETVCMTAMELDPARRYASAAEFARDLGAVLARRPIEARRAGLGLRVARFIQRNPARAATIALSFALVVGGPSLYAWQARRASVVLAAQRDRAERNSQRARDAVDRMLSRVGELDLRFVPQAENVRSAVLRDAAQLLEEFVADEGDDVSARRDVARAHARLGTLMTELGRNAESAEEYSKAIAGMRALLADGVQDETLEAELSDAQLTYADALVGAGLGDRALETLDALVAEFRKPDASVNERVSVVRALQLRGRALIAAGRIPEARETLADSTREADELLERYPNSKTIQSDAEAAWNEYGLALLRYFTEEGKGNLEAEHALERAIELGEAAFARAPDDPTSKSRLANTRNNYAGALRRRQDFDGARAVYEVALGELEDLMVRFPSTLRYKLEAATVVNQIGLSYDWQNRPDQSEAYYARTVEMLEELTRAAPHDATLWHRLGIAYENLGAPILHRGDRRRAIELLQHGMEMSQRALELAPENVEFVQSLSVRCRRLVYTQLDGGFYRAAAESAELAPRIAPDAYSTWSRSAVLLAATVQRVRDAAEIDEHEREWLEQHCVVRAVEMIREAVARGIPAPPDLRQVGDFAPLHGAPGFEALADDIAASASASK